MMQFNDTSNPAALLATRRSGKARDLVAPGPSADELQAILETAMRVPDHGKLAPWRFVVVGDEARGALGAVLVEAYLADKPEASALEIDLARGFASLAPCLVIVLSRPVVGSPIPVWEQELSAGAAIMMLMAAAHARGFVANWLTGWAAYSPQVLAAVGEAGERIAGFVFMGTAVKALDERVRPEFGAVVREWRGELGSSR